MRRFAYQTVDVFTDRRFGGNPLAVFTDARGMSDAEMQSLAAELNYSETTFVLPPTDLTHSAHVRIFNRMQEMPFAGHPNVGTGCVLAAMGRDRDGALLFEEIAGLVKVRVTRDADGTLSAAHIDAPQPLSVGHELPVDGVAACVGLTASDLVVHAHRPRWVSVGLPFYLVEVTREALERASPDLAAFQRLASTLDDAPNRLSIHCYARSTRNALHARMFAPLSGTWEDPATGSANAALAAFLLSLSDESHTAFDIEQGATMGRPSRLLATAMRTAGHIYATVGGGCVPMFKGEIVLD